MTSGLCSTLRIFSSFRLWKSHGISVNMLCVRSILVRQKQLPISAGREDSSLLFRSIVLSRLRRPISTGSCVSLFTARFRRVRDAKSPMSGGRVWIMLWLMSRSSSTSKFLSSSGMVVSWLWPSARMTTSRKKPISVGISSMVSSLWRRSRRCRLVRYPTSPGSVRRLSPYRSSLTRPCRCPISGGRPCSPPLSRRSSSVRHVR
mmetsp:Transcript_49173/g.123624  ORF Transcript_49173/g.123624 Transcript_49173/m.123624 type:complete len:204 (-) Transcript_49173:32-643(-)